ncbi:unnamed protein product, partial [Nesidiocoris tenuis]
MEKRCSFTLLANYKASYVLVAKWKAKSVPDKAEFTRSADPQVRARGVSSIFYDNQIIFMSAQG